MASFKEMNGRIKSISEVVNLPVIQAIETNRAEQFKKLSETLKQFTNSQFPGLNNSSTPGSNPANNAAQQAALEQMFRNITNSRASDDGVSGEKGKLKDPDAEKKNLDSLGNRIVDSQKGGFATLVENLEKLRDGVKNLFPPEAKSAWDELRTLLIGGGILLGIGKLLGIPLADAVYKVLSTGFESVIDFLGNKLSDKLGISLDTLKTSFKIAAVTAIGGVVFGFGNIFKLFAGAVGLFVKGIARMGRFMFGPGNRPPVGGPVGGPMGARGKGYKGTRPLRARAGQLGAPKPSRVMQGARVVGKGLGVGLAVAGAGLSAYDAWQNYQMSKEDEAKGNQDAAFWSKTATWLNGISAGSGLYAAGSALTGAGLPLAGVLGATSLVTYGLGWLAEWRASSLRETAAVEDAKKANEKAEQEYSENLKKMREGAQERNAKRKELWDKKMQSELSPQLSFENSLENLGETIDKSIATLMDWDRRGLNPLQAVAETLQKSFAPQKKDAPSQTNPTAHRDPHYDDKNRYRLTLGLQKVGLP
jgi:hypothetical protein